MKKHLLTLTGLLLSVILFSQGYWRKQEMEVKVHLQSSQQITELHQLKLRGEIHDDHAHLYLTPPELQRVKDLGFEPEIVVVDLNNHNRDFWQQKDAYTSYADIIAIMDSLELNYPDIVMKVSFGESIEGRQLAALKISDNVGSDENEAEVMFDGGIHGDEVGGAENLIRFARMLCYEYGSDPDITNLIDNREIWLYIMVNPDGRENMSRYNSNGVDLNRDWGYMWDAWGGSTGAYSQIESKALRSCMLSNQFVIHTSYHSGTEYISCPWSYRADQPADLDHILYLAGIYSSVSGYPSMPFGQGNSGMYAINGSTKDSNYGIMGSVAWSMEISNAKQPPASQILQYYNYNEPSMLAMIEYAGYGLEGTITDEHTGEPVQAIVFVEDYFQCYSDSTLGDYHKFVYPGTYDLKVVANGYNTKLVNNVSFTDTLSSVIKDIQLTPDTLSNTYVYKIISSHIPNNNEADEGYTMGVFGEPDNVNYSIGKNGWIVLDMQTPIENGPLDDFFVHEGDSDPEGYNCYVSTTPDGPWVLLGSGVGTTGFDLSTALINNVRYIKIDDDGNGSANVPDAGFDLDAIEVVNHTGGMFILLDDFEVDDAGGNNNGIIDPGETVDIHISLVNNGENEAQFTTGAVSGDTSSMIYNVATANYGTMAVGDTVVRTYNVTAKDNIQIGTQYYMTLDISANSGSYSISYLMSFPIGQTPHLIVDLDANQNSGSAMEEAMNTMDLSCHYVNQLPDEINDYTNIFVCLGVYNNNTALSEEDGQKLADFLNQGGNIYMEGGDTWFYDEPTAVHPMFNIEGLDDGNSDLNVEAGWEGTFVNDLFFNYDGDNNYIDRIQVIPPAFSLFKNLSPEYVSAIAYDEGSYKTIGSVFEFGGLRDGIPPSSKVEYMQRILNFFNGVYTGLSETTHSNNSELLVYPNPANDAFTIKFSLDNASDISIIMMDLNGRKIMDITEKKYSNGTHEERFALPANLSKGVYVIRFTSGTTSSTQKIIIG